MSDSSSITIKIASHNINGFSGSKDFLNSRCESEDYAIFAVQEHWLKPAFRKNKGVNQLRSVHPKYDGFGTSAMKQSLSSNVIKGRPYGGTGFIFSKSLNYAVTCQTHYKHDRVTVMKLTTVDSVILIINAYLPFYDTRNLEQQIQCYHETIGYIDYIMSSNSNCKFILAMDMNCNMFDLSHPYTPIVRDLMTKFGLISAFDLDPDFDFSTSYTRCDVKNRSYTLIDGILISNSLSDTVNDIKISHYGDNNSDHSPVELKMNVDCCTSIPTTKKYSSYIPWNSLNETEILNYEKCMELNLDQINIPQSVLHGNSACTCHDHCFSLESYYKDILNAIVQADLTLPRKQHGAAQSFWSPELSDLKHKSIEACELWKVAGCPRSGNIFLEKNRAHLEYKSAIRRAKRDTKFCNSEAMFDDLSSRDHNSFWKKYNSLNGNDENVSRIDGCIDDVEIANCFKDTYSKVYSETDVVRSNELSRRFHDAFNSYYGIQKDDPLDDHYFSWADMLTALGKMKLGKASGGFVKSQHIIFGSPKLAVHLNILYNGLLQHNYVPYDFLCGTITPVVKDRDGNLYDSANYRPIIKYIFTTFGAINSVEDR